MLKHSPHPKALFNILKTALFVSILLMVGCLELPPYRAITVDVSGCGLDLTAEAFADRPCLADEFDYLRGVPEGTVVGCYLESDRFGYAQSAQLMRGIGESGEPRLRPGQFTHRTGTYSSGRRLYYTFMFIHGASEDFCSALNAQSQCDNTDGCRYAIGPVPYASADRSASGRDEYGSCVYSSADGNGVVHPERCDGRDNNCDGAVDNIPECAPEPAIENRENPELRPFEDPLRCEGTADCPNDRPICEEGVCVECIHDVLSCADESRPICGEDGVCRGCVDSNDCSQERVCDADTGRCIQCNGDLDCDGSTPFCNDEGLCQPCNPLAQDECEMGTSCLAEGACGQCQTNVDCPNELPVCDPSTHLCVGCEQQDDCGLGLNCIGNVCVECGPAGHNISYCQDENRPICDAASSTCRPCNQDDECSDGLQCVQGACLACDPMTNDGCSDGRVCAPNGQYCQACEMNAQCEAFYPETPFCDENMGCVVCEPGSNTGCTSDAPICDAETRRCIPCTSDKECSLDGSARCSEGECVACSDDAHCGDRMCADISGTAQCAQCDPSRPMAENGCSENEPYCSRIGRCGACMHNDHCSTRNPVCDLDRNTCRLCEADSECSEQGLLCFGGQCRVCDPNRDAPDLSGVDLGCTPEAPQCALGGTRCI